MKDTNLKERIKGFASSLYNKKPVPLKAKRVCKNKFIKYYFFNII